MWLKSQKLTKNEEVVELITPFFEHALLELFHLVIEQSNRQADRIGGPHPESFATAWLDNIWCIMVLITFSLVSEAVPL